MPGQFGKAVASVPVCVERANSAPFVEGRVVLDPVVHGVPAAARPASTDLRNLRLVANMAVVTPPVHPRGELVYVSTRLRQR